MINTKQYLLTFMIYGEKDFRWFDTEKELRNFIIKRKDDIEIFDAIKIDKGEKLSTRELLKSPADKHKASHVS